MSIGKNIQSLRLRHGLSQKELATIAGVSDKAVSAWEKDRITPRMGAIQKMADYFNIKKSDIIEPVTVTLNVNVENETKVSLNNDETKLLDSYRELNDDDKNFILGMIGRLSFSRTSAEIGTTV